MFFYFAAAVCVVLFVAIARLLMDYAGTSDQLSTTVKAHQRLVDEHRRDIAAMQSRAKEARKEMHTIVQRCSDLDREIRDRVDTLEEVQAQLERRRPKARQVDKDDAAEAA